MAGKGFISLDNLVSAVLMGIGDEQNMRYRIRATQWVLDTIRRLHVNYSPYYREERLYFDNEDLFTIDYPNDVVKVLAVGMYREDEFWPFTKKNNMSILASAAGGMEFDYDANEGLAVPPKGVKFGARASNEAYWVDDPQACRIMVRMFSYYTTDGAWLDRTQWLKDKGIIVRYKSTGVDCKGNVCVPVEAKDLIIQKVVYDFARKGIPQMTNYNIDLQRQEVDTLQLEYEKLLYEPHTFWEVMDAIYGSLNSTARR